MLNVVGFFVVDYHYSILCVNVDFGITSGLQNENKQSEYNYRPFLFIIFLALTNHLM